MIAYKRNQMEQAIAALVERSTAPSAELRTRIKRLLETDRERGRSLKSNDPERANYAFFTEEAPGRGYEVWFSTYEAFAVLTGLRLMQHGWTQGFVVSVMRQLRQSLETQHSRILKQAARQLFDEEAIKRNARA